MAKYLKTPVYGQVVRRLCNFFQGKGFHEVHPQSTLSILSACENPQSIARFDYQGETYPLKQTNQMELEEILLKNPNYKHIYCQTVSYRDEEDPIPGRHDMIFPMFEAEELGSFDDLVNTLSELCFFLGFPTPNKKDLPEEKNLTFTKNGWPMIKYEDACKRYGVTEIEHEQEQKLKEDFGSVVFLYDFPERTHPYANMLRKDGIAKKLDVIINGKETFGCAERSCDAEDIRHRFHTIVDGKFAKRLHRLFTEPRVEKELNSYCALTFVPRWGFGCGLTRLIQAMVEYKLVEVF